MKPINRTFLIFISSLFHDILTNINGGATATQKTFLLIQPQYISAQTGPHQVIFEEYTQMLMGYI
jgi:hypothetical protein